MGVTATCRIRGGALVIALAGCLFLAAACEKQDEQIKVYRVSKAPLENPAAMQAAPPPSASLPPNHPPVSGASPASGPSAVPMSASTAPAPAHWEPQPLAQMRQASFLVRGENGATADISL